MSLYISCNKVVTRVPNRRQYIVLSFLHLCRCTVSCIFCNKYMYVIEWYMYSAHKDQNKYMYMYVSKWSIENFRN